MTMRGITRSIAETLNGSQEFKDLSVSLAGNEFNYMLNIDTYAVVEVPLPYFIIRTTNKLDDKEIEKSYETQFLIGIERQDFIEVNGITEEPTLSNLEELSDKAYEIVEEEIRVFGIQGDKNIKVSYVNMNVIDPTGENDLQIQVDIKLEQDKFLSCK